MGPQYDSLVQLTLPGMDAAIPKKEKKSFNKGKRGCEFCPLDKVKGVHKIFGKIKGKVIMVWGQSPGLNENRAGMEFVGKSGDLLWTALGKAGIERKDCDIQNVVRCAPVDYDPDSYPALNMRTPTKEEIKCCSIYTDEAKEKILSAGQAKVHLILGQIAHKAVLGSEYRKDKKVFWSERLNGHVVCADHPAFFLRGGATSRFKQFMADMRSVARLAQREAGRYAYLEKKKYIPVVDRRSRLEAKRYLLRRHRLGHRIVADLETGKVDDRGRPTRDGSGKTVPLVCGFCAEKGISYVFALDHPDAPITPFDRRQNLKLVRYLLARVGIKYAFHHGSYDIPEMEELLGVSTRYYDYDTEYAEFFRFPDARKYGLAAISDRRFPEFSGYKEIVVPTAFTKSFLAQYPENSKVPLSTRYEKARKTPNALNYALVPWKVIVLYNGADCDVTKRIEVSTANEIPQKLMRKVYMPVAFVLDRMEKFDSPLFDYKHCDLLETLYPPRADRYLRKIREITKNPKFNPNSPPQVSRFIYDKLGLPQINEKPDTQKETMLVLAGYHPFPKYVMEHRALDKIKGTYLAGFRACADANNGHLRTRWWLTGTRTGRLSSGGGPDGLDGVVNLQNIHGDPLLQCLLISDDRWRIVYHYWKIHGDFTAESAKRFDHFYIFLGFDHAQMELRVLAQKSGDKNLIKIFQSGGDPHSLVGHELTGWPVEKIKHDERVRRVIKNMQFGMVYGLTEDSLIVYMRGKGVTEEDASDDQIRRYYHKYFKRFAGVRRMIDNDRAWVEENGYTETMFGFRRYLDVHDQEKGGAFWGNQAVNTPIQGTAHQLMLMGLVPLETKKEKYTLLAHSQLEIHDAIYFRIQLKDLWSAAKLGQEMLEKESMRMVREDFGIDWKIPLKAEPKAGFRFGVQVKDLGCGGPETTHDFLNQWCLKNWELECELANEFAKVVA